jgi:predicted N-acetyltransferase YhbS
MTNTITIEEFDELSESMSSVDNLIKDDAFSDLGELPEGEKQEMAEKYKVIAWKYLFAKMGDKYVGRVVLDKRNVKLSDKEISCVGIGGLAVSSAFQKKGIGRILMNQVVEVSKRSSIDLIFLNAGEDLHEYYENFGFTLHEYKFKGVSGKEYLEDDGMVLVLNKKIHPDLLANTLYIGVGNV